MEHLLFTYTLHKDLDATYTSGSKVTVYYDDTNSNPEDIVVYVDGVQQSSGPGLGANLVTTYYTVEQTGYQYCDGLTLRKYTFLSFNPPFPYAIPIAEENHYSCVEAACDIMLSGPIEVTKATDASTADGQITISASSSYAVKYTLDSDPKYSTAQTSGTFTGLGKGIYRVTAIDEYGCKITQKVTLTTVAESYGVIYRLQYKDRENNTVRDEILKKGHSEVPISIDTIAFDATKANTALKITFDVISLGSGADMYITGGAGLSQYIYIDTDGLIKGSSGATQNMPTDYNLIDGKPHSVEIEMAWDATETSVWSITIDGNTTTGGNDRGLMGGEQFSDITEIGQRDAVGSSPFNGLLSNIKIYVDTSAATTTVDDLVYSLNYLGTAYIKGASKATTLEWPSSLDILDKYIPIRPGKMTINAVSETDFQFVDTFTQDDRELRIRRQKDTGTGYATIWEGYIVPSIYTEPYVTTPYISSLTGTDGLKTLSDQLFVDDDGFKIYGSLKLVKIVAFILKKLDLDLNIRIAANMYEANHATLATDDPFDQSYLDVECFLEDGEPLDCQEVLSRILKPFGAFIIQVDGYWWIIRYEELIASFDYREFTADGVYSANGTYNPIKEVKTATDTSRLVMAFQDQIMEKVPAYGTFNVISKLTERGSVIDGTFERRKLKDQNDDSSGFRNWTFILNNSNAVIKRTSINDNSYAEISDSSLTTAGGIPFLQSKNYNFEYSSEDKLRFTLSYAVDRISDIIPFIVIQTRIKLGSRYLNDLGKWQTTETLRRFYPSPSSEKVEVTVDCPDNTRITETLNIQVYASFSYYPEYRTKAKLKEVATTGLDNYKTYVQRTVSIPFKGTFNFMDYYELDIWTGDGDPTEDDPKLIVPNDYIESSNSKVWTLINRIRTNSLTEITEAPYLVHNLRFYIKNVDVDLLPNGFEPVKEEVTITPNNLQIKERFETDLHVVDLPTGEAYINNSPQIYNNYLRLSNGTRTKAWTRDGVSESNTIQQIYSKSIAAQYLTPSQRISGSYLSDVEIKPIDCLKITQQGKAKYFLIAGISDTDVRNNLYNIDAIELKDAISGGFPATRAHDSGHDSGHS